MARGKGGGVPKKFMLSAHGPKKVNIGIRKDKNGHFWTNNDHFRVFECILPILHVIMPKRPDSGLKLPFLPVLVDFLPRRERSRLWGRGRKKSKEVGYPHAPHAPYVPVTSEIIQCQRGKGIPHQCQKSAPHEFHWLTPSKKWKAIFRTFFVPRSQNSKFLPGVLKTAIFSPFWSKLT